MKKENSNMSFSLLNYYSTTYYRPFTSTADNSSHKKSQVAVVQLQRVEACGKLEFGLHHVTEWSAETLEELTGDKASTTGHQEAVLVHARGQECEEGFVNTVLQESHLKGKQKSNSM